MSEVNTVHVIDFVQPYIEVEEGKPVRIEFTVSDADSDAEKNLTPVINFVDQICDESIRMQRIFGFSFELEKILDYTLDMSCYGASADDNGIYHAHVSVKKDLDPIKEALKRALQKLETIEYHED